MATTTTRKSNTKKPAAVKVPEDHKPKATAETEAKELKTYTAHLLERDWDVDVQRLTDDWEFVESLSAFYTGGQATMLTTTRVLVGLLGPEQYGELKELLRDEETEKIDPAAVIQFARDLLDEASPNS